MATKRADNSQSVSPIQYISLVVFVAPQYIAFDNRWQTVWLDNPNGGKTIPIVIDPPPHNSKSLSLSIRQHTTVVIDPTPMQPKYT
jgi:hypothetical protein